MMTLFHGMGIIMPKQHNRWITASELLVSLGLPITKELQKATGGALCQFSDGHPKQSALRTCRTVRMHAGNSMHLNSIGAVHLAILLLIPVFDTPGTQRQASKKRLTSALNGACKRLRSLQPTGE